jgi:hypothetical protein
MRGLDAWITGGRYSRTDALVTCPECDEQTPVVMETEYGATEWSRDACGSCGREFTGDERWEDDEPPEPEPPDDWDECPRFYPWV